jgi:glycine cleavage system H protein
MSEFKYSKDHEWLLVNGDGTANVGITDFAQKQLGDVVYVELPEVGRQVNKDEDAAVVESVKAASDVKSPVTGSVLEVNEILSDEPEKVNTDPTGEGWFMKLKLDDTDEINQLMNEDEYQAFISDL